MTISFDTNQERGFGSDNHAAVHPMIMKAMAYANSGHAPSYGTDPLTENVISQVQKIFKSKADIYFVFNGTAANVLCLASGLRHYNSCLVTDISHLNQDECAAPEFFAGKLIPIKSTNGKFMIEELESSLIRQGDQHFAQTKMLSLTQPTELGTVYSKDELKQIITWAKKNNLYVHVDGARLANAIHYLNTNYAEMLTEYGVDIISFGGTKNGLMFGEMVVILNSDLKKDFKFLRKQSAQLPSKTRYIAAQFAAYLTNNLDQEIARHAHHHAQYFDEQIRKHIPEIQILYPVQSNAVFAIIPKDWIKTLRKKYFFYVWDEKTFACRLMTSWDTQKSDIDGFIQICQDLRRSKTV